MSVDRAVAELRAALAELDAELAATAEYCATRGFVTRQTGAEIGRAREALANAHRELDRLSASGWAGDERSN